jgi:hypothetical protein
LAASGTHSSGVLSLGLAAEEKKSLAARALPTPVGTCRHKLLAQNTHWALAFPAVAASGDVRSPRENQRLVNGLDTALHITLLRHGLYVGEITTWLHWNGQAVGSHWHGQMLD